MAALSFLLHQCKEKNLVGFKNLRGLGQWLQQKDSSEQQDLRIRWKTNDHFQILKC